MKLLKTKNSLIYLLIFLEINFSFCESILALQEFLLHTFNISFIFLFFFIFFFDKKYIFFYKYFKVICISLLFFFFKKAECKSIFRFLTFKKKKKISRYSTLYSFLYTLHNRKNLLKRGKVIHKFFLKYFKRGIREYVYTTLWAFFISGKKTFTTIFLLRKEIPALEEGSESKHLYLFIFYKHFNLVYRELIRKSIKKDFKKLDSFELDVLSKTSILSSKILLNKDIKILNDIYKNVLLLNFKDKTFFNIDNVKKNLLNITNFKSNVIFNENIEDLRILNTFVKDKIKVVRVICQEKVRRKLAYRIFRAFFFMRGLDYKTLGEYMVRLLNKPKKNFWERPNFPLMRQNIFVYLQRFYICFLVIFGPILDPLGFFYLDHKYPIIVFMLSLFLLYVYNNQFRTFIQKMDKKVELPITEEYIKSITVRDVMGWFWFVYMFVVYLLYFTSTWDVTVKMLYATAAIIIVMSLSIYNRYYRYPRKYK